jgi:hypothetical protein
MAGQSFVVALRLVAYALRCEYERHQERCSTAPGATMLRRWVTQRVTGWLLGAALIAGGDRIAAAQDGSNLMDCDDGQAQRIYDSVVIAGFEFIGAGNDLTNVQNGGDASRFDRWIGGHAPDVVNYVSNVLLGAYNALGDAEFDCDCHIPPLWTLLNGVDETNTVAWTEHNSPQHLIHLCPLYFSLDAYEFGVGTLIHELTHFYSAEDPPEGAVCAAPDNLDPVAMGLKLARDFPDKAVINADSLRLYVLDWDPNQPSSWSCGP